MNLSMQAQDIGPIKESLSKGQYEEALRLCESTLKKLKDNNILKRTKAEVYYYAGISNKELGNYEAADEMYRKAISLESPVKNGNLDLYKYGYSNLLLLRGAYQRAIEMLLEITSQELETQKNLNLSHAYFRRNEKGDIKKALNILDNYLNTYESSDENYSSALQNKGYIYWHEGKQDSAKIYLHKALSLIKDNKRLYNIILSNIAIVEAEQGNYNTAIEDIDEVVSWQEKNLGKTHGDYIISLRKKAEILLKMGAKIQALSAFKEYFLKEKEHMIPLFQTKGNEYRLNYWYSRKPLISEIFLLEDTDPSFLYNVALYRREMALLKTEQSDIEKQVNIDVSQLRNKMLKTDVAIEFTCYYDERQNDTIYAALITSPSFPTKYIRIGTKKDLHFYRLKNGVTLEDGVCSSYLDDKNSIYTDSLLARLIWDPIFKAIPSKTSQIYFAPDGILQMLAIESLPFESLKGKDIHRLTSTANLIKTSKKKAPEKSLIIGGVNYDEIERYQEEVDSVLNNHIAYNYIKNECGINLKPGLFGYLKGTKQEADSILNKIKEADNGDDGRSTEEFIKQHLGDYSIVHLATHGYSLKVKVARVPISLSDSIMSDITLLSSGIVLEGANLAGSKSKKEDGLLSARELCDIKDISNIDLIVLSACQTAQGVVSDEGPVGVVRGLKKGGAHTIMATLWPISDAATMIFMDAFYDALLDGKSSKHNALIKAQEAVRNYTIKKPSVRFSPKTLSSRPIDDEKDNVILIKPYEDPYYWAPFILLDEI